MAVEKTRYTVGDFLKWSQQQESLFELIDGEIVEKVGSFTPSRIAALILTYLNMYLFQHPIGFVTGADGTYVISEGHVFLPDVGYISKERLPKKLEREVPIPPDLAVEVKSPTDAMRQMRIKAEKYVAAGTKMVWLVFPNRQTVEVYLKGE